MFTNSTLRKSLLLILLLSTFLSACSKVEEEVKEPVVEEPSKETEAEALARLQAERDTLEAQRKLDLGEFYVPLPSLSETVELKTEVVKALYITNNIAGFDFKVEDIDAYANYITALSKGENPSEPNTENINKLEKILAMVKSSEINALVIDIKDDRGLVGWASDVALVNTIGANWNTPWRNPEVLMDYLKSENVYTIARIVAFKDPFFAQELPDHAIQLLSGGAYTDKAGFKWVNPFDEYVWKYQIAIAQEAALRGFDEIQYDYVRFPDNAKHYNPITDFPGRNDRDKDEAIEQFLIQAKNALEPYKVHLSADVFGVISHSWDDVPEDIGQTWIKISPTVDYICPMIYPSHYGAGFYGFAVPDAKPFEVIKTALQEGIERNASLEKPAIIRAWLQGFTATWIKGHITYDEVAIQDQILAAKSLGLEEYIIWNAANTYLPLSYFYDHRTVPSLLPNTDLLERSPEDSLKRYLEAQIFGRNNQLYLLTPIALRAMDYDTYISEVNANHLKLNNYEILSISAQSDGTYLASVNASYVSDEGTATLENASYTIQLENGMFKIIQPEFTWIKAS